MGIMRALRVIKGDWRAPASGPTGIGITMRKPDRPGTVRQYEVLILHIAVRAVTGDNRVHAQHLARHVGPADWPSTGTSSRTR